MDSTKQHTDTQQILSICYGYGGLERGVSSVIPIKPVAYVEIEAFQNFNLVAAMESGLVDSAPIWTDLKTFDAKPFHKKLHGIIGGYPCQGESLAGKRELWNDDRFLWPYLENIMRTAKPVWGFFENVSGHLSGSFPYVLDSLRSLGYKVECGIYSAEEAGAPHQRKRLFILAVDDTAGSGLWEIQRTQIENRKSESKNGRKLEDGFERSIETKLAYTEDILLQGCKLRPGEIKLRRGSTQLADTFSLRSGESVQRSESSKFNQNGTKWPAYRGQPRYEWEAKRTVKPGVGCTINGYNFRTELLRQYGNGVVSQTAEIAFRDLLNKQFETSN